MSPARRPGGAGKQQRFCTACRGSLNGRGYSADGGEGLEQLVARVYQELRRLARHMLRNQHPGKACKPATWSMVYLKLVEAATWIGGTARISWGSATMMRRILIDRARRRMAAKRGGKFAPIQLSESLDLATDRSPELIAPDDALNMLAEIDPRTARVVELPSSWASA